MCGIAGIINLKNEDIERRQVLQMMSLIKHRGPDDDGIFVDNNVGLGFVRLSIIDLSQSGHQPMFSQNRRYVIIYNGEVYNYIEIREELESEGYVFHTNSDTEVVLASFQKWGKKCLNKFNGMFAFVIYDTMNKDIFAARDRFGIKPFYYYLDEDELIFASEIKAILPFIKREANFEAISNYLLFNRTDYSSDTFFKGIKKLPHGGQLEIHKNQVTYSKWYNLKENIFNKEFRPKDFRSMLTDSIKLRLRADVPIGVSLSGGIDSSVITSSVLHDFALTDINTFSAVYDKTSPVDESEYIEEYREDVKNMHFVSPNAHSLNDDLHSFIDAHTEPCPDLGPYIQYKVMELASKSVKITLDGQGADEQLAGYHNFFSIYFLELLRKKKLRLLFKEVIKYVVNHKSLDAFKYTLFYVLNPKIQNLLNKTRFPSVKKSFAKQNVHKYINRSLYKPQGLNDSLFSHFEYKLEHLLRWEDINSMHFSVEARVPFLDHRLVESTLSSPPYTKIYNGETKNILRQAYKDILPKKIVNRKDKKGFSNPRKEWLKSSKFQKIIFDIIYSESFKNRGVFDADIAKRQYQKHLQDKIDASNEIWKWINLELWFRKFID